MKLSLILFASLLLFALEASADWTKDCKKYAYEKSGKDIFVGNPANIYPHIHCQKGFIVFSHSKSSHTYLAKGDQAKCTSIKKAATTPEQYNYMKEADKAKGLVSELNADYCNRMSMMKRLLMHLLLDN